MTPGRLVFAEGQVLKNFKKPDFGAVKGFKRPIRDDPFTLAYHQPVPVAFAGNERPIKVIQR